MAKYDDLDEFGFEPIDPQELEEFGFEEETPEAAKAAPKTPAPAQEVEPEIMGAGEAAITGFGEGTTFGLGPILAGIAGAGGEVVEDIGDVLGMTQDAELEEQGFTVEDPEKGLQGLLDAYYSSRDIARRQQERAFEERPYTTTAGSIAGGLASFGGAAKLAGKLGTGGRAAQAVSKILPKAESLKGASTVQKAGVGLREGAKAGGLAGFGSGEAKLAEGEVGEALAETGGTAIGGGLLGGAAPFAGAGIKKAGQFVKDLPLIESVGLGFKAGKKGIDIGNEEQVVNYITGVADDVRNTISKNFSGASKQQLLEEADEIGVRVAAGEPIEEVINQIKQEGGFGKKAQKELGQFVEDLKSLSQSYDPAMQKALGNVEKSAAKKAMQIARKGGSVEMRTDLDEQFDDLVPLPEQPGKVVGVEDKFRIPVGEGKFREGTNLSTAALLEGEVPLKQYDLSQMKLSELDEVIRKIGQRGFESDDAAVPFARELYGRLRQASNEALESSSLPERNRKLKNMFDALESLDIDPKKFFSGQETVQDEVQKKIFQKITSGSLAGDLDMKNFLKYMGRADERIAENIKEKASFAKDLGKFIQQSEGEGSVSLRAAAGPVQKVLAKGGGLLGGGVRTASEAKSAIFKRMGDMTPDEALEFGTKLSERYGDKAQPFVNALTKAVQADGHRKNALMYGLYQQPAFRKMLEEAGRVTIDEEDEIQTNLRDFGTEEAPSGITESPLSELDDFGFSPMRETQQEQEEVPENIIQDLIQSEGTAAQLNREVEYQGLKGPANSRVAGSTDTGLYYDSRGFLTSGFGDLVTSEQEAQEKREQTRDEALSELLANYRTAKNQAAEVAAEHGIDMNQLSEPQKEALAEMTFQMGKEGVSGFKNTLNLIRQGRYAEAAEEAADSDWAKQTPARVRKFQERIVQEK